MKQDRDAMEKKKQLLAIKHVIAIENKSQN